VKLVQIAGNHGGNIESGSSGSATHSRGWLAAGIAVTGASLIAVNPVAPIASNSASEIVHRAVQLTSADAAADLTFGWDTVVTDAVTNLQQIGGEIQADPLPVLAQVIANQLAFSDTLDTNLQSLGTGLNTLISDDLPQLIQTLTAGIEAGDIGTSWNDFTGSLLLDLLPTATPLVNILDIPGEIAQNLANVVTNDLPNVGLEVLLSPLGILFGTSQAFADGSQSILDALDAGQTTQALDDLLNMPALVTGAFINGYDTLDTYGIGYGGLLSSGESAAGTGLLDVLLVQLPQEIASTLADGGTPATLAGDLTAIFGDLGSAF
jgi:hypothetical protein